ncbi:hypothetical protein IV203_021252 [Nitzschia inconspicua]|uniref:DUF6824 domain-containing protein n=1 Tax=Nitzschia inconspicua TaxID=303405 RepID=A0A9K3KGL2_9STRA|nr:hypothetical protein IV203_021252 [Nitzschia inconspicua]
MRRNNFMESASSGLDSWTSVCSASLPLSLDLVSSHLSSNPLFAQSSLSLLAGSHSCTSSLTLLDSNPGPSPLSSQMSQGILQQSFPQSSGASTPPVSDSVSVATVKGNHVVAQPKQHPVLFQDQNRDKTERLLEALRRAGPPSTPTEKSPLDVIADAAKVKKEEEEDGDESCCDSSVTEKKFDGVVPRNDIMFGRGTAIYDWHGNVRLRGLVKDRQDDYKKFGETRIGKTAMSKEIADHLRNEGVCFWDRKPGSKKWYKLDYKADSRRIREKISSSLRAPYDNTDYYKQKRERFERMKKEKAAASAANKEKKKKKEGHGGSRKSNAAAAVAVEDEKEERGSRIRMQN